MIKIYEDNKISEKLLTTKNNNLILENKTDEQIISDYKNNKNKYEPMCSLEEFCRKNGIEL